ncbi:MAG: hypothetical protein MJ237_07065 [bacterium]|nr:hypothetical protein [bacterium]
MAEIVNFLTRVLTSQPTYQAHEVRRTNARSSSSNPFASSNPFVNSNSNNPFATYGQNRPVIGGYFAGYYNNQPNIVGRRLFIEA